MTTEGYERLVHYKPTVEEPTSACGVKPGNGRVFSDIKSLVTCPFCVTLIKNSIILNHPDSNRGDKLDFTRVFEQVNPPLAPNWYSPREGFAYQQGYIDGQKSIQGEVTEAIRKARTDGQ